MRKPRDYDAELKALDGKAKQLKARKITQLGELVIACGGDALPTEELAGVLLEAAGLDDPATKARWGQRGAAFFQGSRADRSGARGNGHVAEASDGGAAPASAKPIAA